VSLKLSNKSSSEVVTLSRTPSPFSIAVRNAAISLPYLVLSVATTKAKEKTNNLDPLLSREGFE